MNAVKSTRKLDSSGGGAWPALAGSALFDPQELELRTAVARNFAIQARHQRALRRKPDLLAPAAGSAAAGPVAGHPRELIDTWRRRFRVAARDRILRQRAQLRAPPLGISGSVPDQRETLVQRVAALQRKDGDPRNIVPRHVGGDVVLARDHGEAISSTGTVEQSGRTDDGVR